ACYLERWPDADQAGGLSAGQREKSCLGCRAGKEASAFGRASAWSRSLRENLGSSLVARPAEWGASFAEIAEDVVNKSSSSRAKTPVRLGSRDPAEIPLKISRRDSSTSLRMTKAARLRELIAKDGVAMPGVPNASIARQVERAGFDGVYISGAGLANSTAGLPDIGLLTLSEVALLAGFIARAVKIPAIVDADTGFGGAENAARTIYQLGH